MVSAARLIESPRGRRFCVAVAELADPSDSLHAALGTAAYFSQDPAVELRTIVTEVNSISASRVDALSVTDLLAAVATAVAYARYWQPPDEEDTLLAAPDVLDALRRIRDVVVESPHVSWWSDGPDLGAQRAVLDYEPHLGGWGEKCASRWEPSWARWREELVDTERSAAHARRPSPSAESSGLWWSSPVDAGCRYTTRAVPGLPALALDLTEDANGSTRSRVYQAEPVGDPRIYEVGGPDQWAELVRRYPIEVTASKRGDWYETTGRDGPWHMPDWAAVAADYDAVHLSVAGYLTTAGVAVPVDVSGVDSATVLAGFGPDETYWLNPNSIDIVGDPTEYVLDDRQVWVVDR